ncbi:MAG: hypothetical protein PWQ06_2232 [Anaerophaga sp.]|nr:hypothetical protein [Anaerophaga sp.]
MIQGRKFLKSGGQYLLNLYSEAMRKWFHFFDKFRGFMSKHSYFGRLNYFVPVHKMPFTLLRLAEKYLFTISKLRIFGLCKPCKGHLLNRQMI